MTVVGLSLYGEDPGVVVSSVSVDWSISELCACPSCPDPKLPYLITINSTKKRAKIVMRMIPSTHEYSVIGPVRHGFVNASSAGPSKWTNAVATMTPDPKYLQIKKTHSGTLSPLCRFAKMGKVAPIEEVTQMMKRAATRRPMRPSYSLPVSQAGLVSASSCRAIRFAKDSRDAMVGRTVDGDGSQQVGKSYVEWGRREDAHEYIARVGQEERLHELEWTRGRLV